MEKPGRKPNRLKEYDYSRPGAYFVTVCTHQREELLSSISVGEGLAPPETRLTQYGRIAEEQLLLLETRYPSVRIDQYVIMPNHIHAIIRIEGNCVGAGGASPSPTLFNIIGTYKSLTTRLCSEVCRLPRLFQRSFYDHVIRNDDDYRTIWEYIENNPAKWKEDRFYTE